MYNRWVYTVIVMHSTFTTFCLQCLRYERRSPNGTNSRASASGSAVETQPTIWTTWQHSPEDTFFSMAISSRKFCTSRSSTPPAKD